MASLVSKHPFVNGKQLGGGALVVRSSSRAGHTWSLYTVENGVGSLVHRTMLRVVARGRALAWGGQS